MKATPVELSNKGNPYRWVEAETVDDCLLLRDWLYITMTLSGFVLAEGKTFYAVYKVWMPEVFARYYV